jgi:hypothetical protein
MRLHSVDGCVGIEHWYPGAAKGSGSRRLAHSNATSQAKYDHCARRSAATKRRSSSSTSGFVPNQA